jgi:hypothetical protein
MLGEAVLAERSLRELAADAPRVDAAQAVQPARRIQRTLSMKAWC